MTDVHIPDGFMFEFEQFFIKWKFSFMEKRKIKQAEKIGDTNTLSIMYYTKCGYCFQQTCIKLSIELDATQATLLFKEILLQHDLNFGENEVIARENITSWNINLIKIPNGWTINLTI